MSIQGLRVHIAGSAAYDSDRALLLAAHNLIRELVCRLVDAGAGLVTGVSGEPLGKEDLPLIFDWTVLEALADVSDPAPSWPGRRSGRFRVVASQRGLENIPDRREAIWRLCTARSDFEMETLPPGWRMGGVIRSQQVLHGDVLVVLGGGAGVEHLAELYLDEGKRVIPVRCDLGAITKDGNGGSSYLHAQALHDVGAFFSLADGTGGAAARLTNLQLEADSNVSEVTTTLVSLLEDLRPPLAFYVRLLDRKSTAFKPVDSFFRDVVDQVVINEGFEPYEIGRSVPLAPFMNVEIFEALHRAGLVVVDLSDVRPNCMMELGYALARRRSVIISAMRGTRLPFDQDKLPTYFWDESEGDQRIDDYRDWFQRHIDMPPLVK